MPATVPPRFPLHLRVFIASPGDVATERALTLEVLEWLESDPAYRGKLMLEAVAWDKPGAGAPMLATLTPQAAIAKGLAKPSECDIVILILWSRMGTPLPMDFGKKDDSSAYLSGTEWEYLDALAAAKAYGRPEVLVYRRDEKVLLDMDDSHCKENASQYENVKTFFAGFTNPDGSQNGGYKKYAKPDDFRALLESDLRALIHQRMQSHTPAAAPPRQPVEAPPPWPGSPFPGLRAFAPDDAPIFFGRGREADELAQKFRDPACRLVAVVGASGSGKSSLIGAGLIPKLKSNAIDGAKDWLLPDAQPGPPGQRKQWTGLRFTPGETGGNPFLALAIKLAALLPDDAPGPGELAEALEAQPSALTGTIEQALRQRPAWAEALVFIDQFEELFTLVKDKLIRQRFVDLLQQPGRLRWVLTLRADFYHHCVEIPALAERLRTGSFPLAAPSLGTLQQMLTGPAVRAGLVFEDGLPQRILDDAGQDPGALALLAFALHELYEEIPAGPPFAQGGTGAAARLLSHAAYAKTGGVQAAIGNRAEAAFNKLPAEAQQQLKAVFCKLVDADEQGKATRRRVAYADLAKAPTAAKLVDAFIKARLLVADRTAAGGAVVEVAHEALFREWPRLADWIKERGDDFRIRRYAEISALEWQRDGSQYSHLWPLARLSKFYDALERLELDPRQLSNPLKGFLRFDAEHLWATMQQLDITEELAREISNHLKFIGEKEIPFPVERLLAEIKNPEITHGFRAAIGDWLEAIGDPRPGVRLRPDGVPDIVWCEVPPGEVRLKDVTGVFQVQPCRIAQYPITYCQYLAFLGDPEGYRNPAWWLGLRRQQKPDKQYQRISNYPADNVSWYDAMAYCRWLSTRLGYEVRLPTEWEWQQAASGGQPGHVFPWGEKWDGRKANTAGSDLGRTTAVGLYPQGISPVGALDMAGNVWEWCLNPNDHPKRQDMADDVQRVLRGGSWHPYPDVARVACRNHLNPGDRGDDLGFRVAASPSHP